MRVSHLGFYSYKRLVFYILTEFWSSYAGVTPLAYFAYSSIS